jgi:hypothetical protein
MEVLDHRIERVTDMDTAERYRILQQARDAVERTAHINPSEWSALAAPDVLKDWKSNMPKAEPPKRVRGLDTAPVDWDAIINARITNMKDFVMTVIGEALRESFEIERAAYADAVQQRDRKIADLELTLLHTQAEVAKLNASVVELKLERDREQGKVLDLPPLPKRQVVN